MKREEKIDEEVLKITEKKPADHKSNECEADTSWEYGTEGQRGQKGTKWVRGLKGHIGEVG